MRTEDERDAFDLSDPLAALRRRFARPHSPDGTDSFDGELAYLCGHSLGLMPLAARDDVEAVLDAWAALGVGGPSGMSSLDTSESPRSSGRTSSVLPTRMAR